jgi:hypothetical protein
MKTSSLKRARKANAAKNSDAELLEWCIRNGAALDGCELVQGPSMRGFIATKNLLPGHCAISIPHALFVTTEVAMKSTVGESIIACPTLRVASNLEAERRAWAERRRADRDNDDDDDVSVRIISRRSVLYAYLIHQRFVEAKGAAWEPYAASLPTDYTTPFTWYSSPNQIGHMAIRTEVEALELHLNGQYDSLFPALSDAHPTLFPAHIFTRAAWLWSHSSYSTRSFPAGVFGEQARSNLDDGVMFPLMAADCL